MRSYVNLSDHDFELLIADLFYSETGHRYEAFARGADRGIDLRYTEEAALHVVQCKHMVGSSVSQLVAAARVERSKLFSLAIPPDTYRFVTSRPLTALNKSAISEALGPWISNDNQILGADDLEGLLNRFPSVERAHVKLWLSSGGYLESALASEIWARSAQMLGEIKRALPRYVETGTYAEAREKLLDERVLLLSGAPGIGKTTLARMLVADAVSDGYEPIEISADVEEGNKVINDRDRRVFYYDDFLGSTFLQDRLSKNEDKRLASFIRKCRSSENNLLVLTTREHILNQAKAWYEELDRSGIPMLKLLLELRSYTHYERAEILHSHLVHSPEVDSVALSGLLADGAYLKVIDHKNYNPRLIEFVTGMSSAQLPTETRQNYASFVLSVLAKPDILWESAFEKQLDEDCKDIVVSLSSIPVSASKKSLEHCFDASASARRRTPSRGGFISALRTLDDSFTSSNRRYGQLEIGLANPSIADFAASWLSRSTAESVAAIDSAVYFEQLEWLYAKLVDTAETTNQAELSTAFVNAIVRCQDAEAIDTYGKTDSSLRLTFAYKTMADNSVIREILTEWFKEQLQRELSRWRADAQRRLNGPVTLVTSLGADVGQSLLTALHEGLNDLIEEKTSGLWATTEDWEQFDLFSRFLDPDFGDHPASISTRFQFWAIMRLDTEPESFDDYSDMDDLAELSELFGVNIQDDLSWEAVRAQINSREDDWSPPDARESVVAKPTMDASEQKQRIDLIFGQLSDGLSALA